MIGTEIMGWRLIAALEQHPRFFVASAWDVDPGAVRQAVPSTVTAPGATDIHDLPDDPSGDAVDARRLRAWPQGVRPRNGRAGATRA